MQKMRIRRPCDTSTKFCTGDASWVLHRNCVCSRRVGVPLLFSARTSTCVHKPRMPTTKLKGSLQFPETGPLLQHVAGSSQRMAVIWGCSGHCALLFDTSLTSPTHQDFYTLDPLAGMNSKAAWPDLNGEQARGRILWNAELTQTRSSTFGSQAGPLTLRLFCGNPRPARAGRDLQLSYTVTCSALLPGRPEPPQPNPNITQLRPLATSPSTCPDSVVGFVCVRVHLTLRLLGLGSLLRLQGAKIIRVNSCRLSFSTACGEVGAAFQQQGSSGFLNFQAGLVKAPSPAARNRVTRLDVVGHIVKEPLSPISLAWATLTQT